jgi:TPR repeat protein
MINLKLILVIFLLMCIPVQAVAGDSTDELRKAANQGQADAQFLLGARYESGKGITQDYKEAVKWYRMAADQGYARAQLLLGIMYEKGKGTTQDHKEAAKWYRMAANQGNENAQRNLDRLCKESPWVCK